jgi:hypothetical protein
MFELVKCAIDCVFALPVDWVGVRKGKDESFEEAKETDTLLEETMAALHDLLHEILIKNPTPACLNDMFKVGGSHVLTLVCLHPEWGFGHCFTLTDIKAY